METLKVVALIILIFLILLIIVGFLLQKFKLSFTSSLISMLPVFGYFGISMTWLFGPSALMLLWFPISETCPEILGLGDIVFAPFLVPLLASWNSIDRWNYGDYTALATIILVLTFLIIVGGMFLLVFSITTWLYGKSHGHELINFWIYKYSRHPQYLGFLVLSYGSVYLGFHPDHYIPAPTLFWLIYALSTIGIALREENQLLAQKNQEYVRWRSRTPFMVPLPKLVSGLILTPVKLLLKKDWPENDKEIVFVLTIYGLLLILCSLPIIDLYWWH